MGRHLSETDVTSYTNRTLPPNALLSFDDHLIECDKCFKMINENKSIAIDSLQNALLQDAEDAHLTYEQFEAYLDDQVDEVEKEIIEVHRGVCEECTNQLEGLLQLRASIEIENNRAALARFSIWNLWGAIEASFALKFAVSATGLIAVGFLLWASWFLLKLPQLEITDVSAPILNNDVDQQNSLNQPNVNEHSDVEVAGASNPDTKRSVVIVSLVDGAARIALNEDGSLTGLDMPQYEKKIRSVLTNQTITFPRETNQLRSKSGVLMGTSESGVPFALSNPIGKVVRSDRPDFTWKPLKDAESYTVSIYDKNFNKIMSSPPLQRTAWRADVALKRGATYQWQVSATKDGQEVKSPIRPAPDAKFMILDGAKASEIERAEKSGRISHFLLGVLYANAGLLDDAEREFQLLRSKNPNSELVRKLLIQVQSAR
jgi:hypothetical protein